MTADFKSDQRERAMPPFNWHGQKDLRLQAHPGYERDILILEGHAMAGVLIRVRLDRDAREWLRCWLDHIDANGQAAPDDIEVARKDDDA